MALVNYLEKLKHGSIWSLIARIFGSGFGFIVTILLARVLTLEMLGIFYLIQAIIRFSGLFIKMGLEFSIQKINGIYSSASDWDAVRRCTKSMIGIFCISTLLFLFFLSSIWKWLAIDILNAPVLLSLTLLVFLAIPLRAVEELSSSFFRSVHVPRIGVFLMDVPRQTVFMFFLIILYFYFPGAELDTVLKDYVISSFFAVILSALLIIMWFKDKNYKDSSHDHHEARIGALIKLSLPMMLQGGAAIIMSTADIWVLSIFSTQENVAVYGSVVRLTTLIVLVLGVVNMVLPSMLATLYKQGDLSQAEKLMRTSASWSAFIAIPLLLIFILFGEAVLDVVFGVAFIGGYHILIVLATAHTINALSGSPGMWLQMTGYHSVLMKLTIFWSIFNLLANIVLVNKYGVLGVAVVTGVSVVFQNITMIVFVKKIHNIKTWVYLPALSVVKN